MPDDLEIGGPPTDIPKEFASTSPHPIRPATSELGMVMRAFEELKGRVERIEGMDGAQKSGSTTGPTMSAPTRDEIDAKLAASEARSETRFVELSGKLDRVLDAVAVSNVRVGEVRDQMAGVKSDNKSTRWTIAVTVVAAVLAALAALWTTQSNLLSAFQVRLAVSQVQPAAIPTSPVPALSTK